nr:hypothetical protein [uncultured Devosia sp.]
MFDQSAHFGVAPHAWLQHKLPWLGLFALILSLFAEEADIPFGEDELNG